jgi:alkylation response protein AidB-like acyl-CoA dehydrogenase
MMIVDFDSYTLEVAEASPQILAAQRMRDLIEREARDRDEAGRFPYEEIKELCKSGLAALWVPTEYGGFGGSGSDLVRVCSVLAEGDSSISQMLITHTYGVQIIQYGSFEEQVRSRFYKELVSGDLWITNAVSERGTKNIFEYKVQVRRNVDGGWILSGTKHYATGSLGGQYMYVAAVDADAELGENEAAGDLGKIRMAFIDVTWPGVTIVDDWNGIGQRTTASGTVVFDEVQVPDEMCISTDELAGSNSLFGVISQAAFGAVYLGVARGALRTFLDYVRNKARPWIHSPADQASEDPFVLSRVGELHARISTGEALLEKAVEAIDVAEADGSMESRGEAAIAGAAFKAFTTDAALTVCEEVFELAGAGTTRRAHGFDRFWRDVRTLTLHDPVDYRYSMVGNFVINGEYPPVTSFT